MNLEGYPTIYHALAAGDPDAVRRFAPRVAALAAEARKASASTARAPSSPRSTTAATPALRSISPPGNIDMTSQLASAGASRAAQAAEIHLGPINASRKRCGLPPLTASELASEFADLDRMPAPAAKTSRREAANMRVSRRGGPTTQAAIDAMWSGIAAKRNAELAARRPPLGSSASRRDSPDLADTSQAAAHRQSQAEIDSMWTGIARSLNAEAGLRTPARGHAR
jgi:hypothetical protein